MKQNPKLVTEEPQQKASEEPVKKPRKKSKASKKPHYVNSKELLQQIKDYYNQPPEQDMEEILAINISKIAKGLSFAPNFINYSYKDDMIGDAVVKMFTALQNKKFDVDSGYNPFSYFTTIAFHAFINRIKREKKYRDIVTEYQEAVYEEIMGGDNDVSDVQKVNYTNPYDSE
jgi:hypothetical protein